MNAWQDILSGFDFQPLLRILLGAVPALVCITLHELSHGFVAYLLGDPTAKNAGRLTLNPIKHLDWVGFLMLVVAHVGWAKPVPVNMRYFKNPKAGMAITALAGPASNFLITALVLLIYGFVYPFYYTKPTIAGDYGMQLLELTAYISLGLGLFNLLPIPPLDGSKVLFSFLPDRWYLTLMRYERYGMIALIVLAYTGLTGSFLSVAIDAVYQWMFRLAEWAFQLSAALFFA